MTAEARLAHEDGTTIRDPRSPVPSYLKQARTGRGPVGDLVQRYNLDEYLQRNQARLRESANRLTTPAIC